MLRCVIRIQRRIMSTMCLNSGKLEPTIDWDFFRDLPETNSSIPSLKEIHIQKVEKDAAARRKRRALPGHPKTNDRNERLRNYELALAALKAMTPESGLVHGHRRFTNKKISPNIPLTSRMQGKTARKEPTHFSFAAHIHNLCTERHVDSRERSQLLLQVLSDPNNQYLLSPRAFALALGYAYRIDDLVLMQTLLFKLQEEDIKPTTSICETVLGQFTRMRDIEQFRVTLKTFGEMGVRASVGMWNQLLTMSTPAEKKSVLQIMKACHVKCDSVTLSIVLPLHRARCATPLQFVQSLRDMPLSVDNGEVLVKMLLREKELDLVFDLLEGDLETRLLPSLRSIHHILQYLTVERRPVSWYRFGYPYAQRLCRFMEESDLQPTDLTFEKLFGLGVAWKKMSFMLMIYDTANSKNKVSPKLREKFTLYQEAIEKKCQNQGHTWNSFLLYG